MKELLNQVNRRFIRDSILASIKTIEDKAKVVGYSQTQEDLDMIDSLTQIYNDPDAWVTIV